MTRAVIAIMAVLAGAGLLLVPAAHADADSYIGTLDVMGVPYRNRDAAIQFGEVICRALEGGTPFSTLVNLTTSDGYYSTYQARALIGAAVGGLCRQEEASVPSE